MNELTLINKIKHRDEEGLYEFIDRYGGIMKSVVAKILWQYPHLWDDAMNDAMLCIWENINSFDPSRSSFKNWCATVSKYRAIDILRVESRHKTESLEDLNVFDDSSIDGNLEVEEVLNALPPRDAEIFRSIFIEGNDYETTGEKLGMKTNTVYSRVSRGRKLLKKRRGDILNEKL